MPLHNATWTQLPSCAASVPRPGAVSVSKGIGDANLGCFYHHKEWP